MHPSCSTAHLMRVARNHEARGEAIRAIVAYREVIVCGEVEAAQEARRRVQELALRAWPDRPL